MKKAQALQIIGVSEDQFVTLIASLAETYTAEHKQVPQDISAESTDISRESVKLLKDLKDRQASLALPPGLTKQDVIDRFPERDASDIESMMVSLRIADKQSYAEEDVQKIAAHFEIASAAVDQIGMESLGGSDGEPTRGQLATAKTTAIQIAQKRNVKINKNAIGIALKLQVDYGQMLGEFLSTAMWNQVDTAVANRNMQEVEKRFGVQVSELTEIAAIVNDPTKLKEFLTSNGGSTSEAASSRMESFVNEESATSEGKLFDKDMAADFLASGQPLQEWQKQKDLPTGLTMKDYMNLSAALREQMSA